MNKELLFQLYSIHSPSGSEKRMRKFLRRQATKRGAQSIVTDDNGNLLITKGNADTFPCVAAHIDQVQDFHSKDFTVVQIGDDVIGWSPKCHKQQGLGADDKNGVYICLECLERFDNIKVAFFVGEERGCIGSSEVDLDFFKDCRFIIEPDRRGGNDLITSMSCGAVCSDDFIDAIGAEKFGYKDAHGTITDVGELVERGVGISCLNLSCGYYNAHCDDEMVILSELENCLNFVMHIVENVTDVFPFEYTPRVYSWGNSSGYKYGNYGYGYLYGNSWGKNEKQYSFYDDYNAEKEAEDEEFMEQILQNDSEMSFEEVYFEWGSCFNTDDRSKLLELYNNAKWYYRGDTSNEDFWDGENEGEYEGTLFDVQHRVS